MESQLMKMKQCNLYFEFYTKILERNNINKLLVDLKKKVNSVYNSLLQYVHNVFLKILMQVQGNNNKKQIKIF